MAIRKDLLCRLKAMAVDRDDVVAVLMCALPVHRNFRALLIACCHFERGFDSLMNCFGE
jgi:hypothetical protein